ncbi:hypothetical protein P46FS4_156 [Salmonella phage P46FS4]|uniref:Uncharacterized protein n=1 Tax=Salmonella phage P46FS4 TaxID=2712940 RepID=A0A6G6XTR4_9CAUD|nr:hypothetical protein HYQ39_gp156 [Salmonella phage P46FS4]QIG62222.1 hypothetical protein P46FS4_156 [Salmonella phage P46FS4]
MRKPVTEEMLAKAALRPKEKFALFPVRLHDGSWIWLQPYVRAPIGLYADCEFNIFEYVDFVNGKIPAKERNYTLKQYRVGGGWDEDGEYFPHRNFHTFDNSYQTVDYASNFGRTSLEILLEKAGEI